MLEAVVTKTPQKPADCFDYIVKPGNSDWSLITLRNKGREIRLGRKGLWTVQEVVDDLKMWYDAYVSILSDDGKFDRYCKAMSIVHNDPRYVDPANQTFVRFYMRKYILTIWQLLEVNPCLPLISKTECCT